MAHGEVVRMLAGYYNVGEDLFDAKSFFRDHPRTPRLEADLSELERLGYISLDASSSEGIVDVDFRQPFVNLLRANHLI